MRAPIGIVALLIVGCGHDIKDAQRASAKADVQTLHQVGEQYRVDHATEPCPTAETLRTAKMLSPASKITDPWDTPYRLTCTDDAVVASSAGPDRAFGTPDDITAPESKH